MITIDEAYDIINDINDRAHDLAWDSWEEAGDDEYLREEASDEQAAHFNDMFNELSEDQRQSIYHYAEIDESFAMDFNCWNGRGII